MGDVGSGVVGGVEKDHNMLWIMFRCDSPRAVSLRISRYLVMACDLLIIDLHLAMYVSIITVRIAISCSGTLISIHLEQ